MLISSNLKQYLVPVLIWCGVVAVIFGGALFMANAASVDTLPDMFVGGQTATASEPRSCLRL